MPKQTIYLLIDYREMFYSSTKEVAGSMDIHKLKKLFEQAGYHVFIERFTDVSFQSKKYRGAFILYQSSEDPDLKYKDYIEDVLLGLELAGAKLVPNFHLFRAHHNKVFMEILRDASNFDYIQSVVSKSYGTLEDLDTDVRYPVVVKPGAGSRGSGVRLASNKQELVENVHSVARSFSTLNLRRRIANFFLRKGYKAISQHRNKFVVQNHIPGLQGDYKVLVYADRYYVLKRENRVNDFRASGSGLLSFPKETPRAVLAYAESVFECFDSPFASLDIAIKGEELFLLEFQFLSFGQYALEHSDHYYIKQDDQWERVNGVSDLEETFVYAVNAYLQKKEV